MKYSSRTYQASAKRNAAALCGSAPGVCVRAGTQDSSRGGAGARRFIRNAFRSTAAYFFGLQRTYICRNLLAVFILLFFSATAFAVPPNTNIDNTASAAYTVSGAGFISSSNLVRVTTTVVRTNSTLEFLQYAPTAPGAQSVTVSTTEYSTSGTGAGPFAPLGAPIPLGGGGPIDLSNPVLLVTASLYHAGEPLFVRLTDLDQNIDPVVVETVLVTIQISALGETEMLRLQETGPNTGVFTGSIQTGQGPAAIGNGVLNVAEGSQVVGTYADFWDGTDTRTVAALVDPYGTTFSSATGQHVDGVTITLIDATTGLPATVYGDDGISNFPATIVTGGSATDSSGTLYTFPPGGYRFPLVPIGTYRFQVAPPAGYAMPSTVSTAVLQTLAGGPFAIVPGSRGEDFVINPGPVVHIDIPLDPFLERVYLVKTSSKTTAAVGDFLQYRITAENTDSINPVSALSLTDRLPVGFRYRKGSAKIDGSITSGPAVSADGRVLTFSLGNLAAGQKVEITYVVEVAAGSKIGRVMNTAVASTPVDGVVSNTASATVQVKEDLFRSKGFIMGRVIVDGCEDPELKKGDGLEGVRIYLEDGTSVVTDRNGMFHFEGVKPGTHVVQLDRDSLPEMYEVLACEQKTRFAGSGHSQFVELMGGTMMRADFHLGLRPRVKGEAEIELMSAVPQKGKNENLDLQPNTVRFSVLVRVGGVPLRNLRLTILLPDGASYLRGSSSLNDSPLPDPKIMENALSYRLPNVRGDWDGTLSFNAAVDPLINATELRTKAVLTVDTPAAKNVKTPVAENVLTRSAQEERMAVPELTLRPRFRSLSAKLSRQDKVELNRLVRRLRKLKVRYIMATGHTDSDRIRNKRRYRDNYELSEARADAVANYLADALNLSLSQIIIIPRGADEPVASNATAQGRALNRRVELKVLSEIVVHWSEYSNSTRSGMKTVSTEGQRAGEVWHEENRSIDAEAPGSRDFDLDAAEPGFALVWPPESFYPPIPSITVAVKQNPRENVKLFVNGSEVSALYYDGMKKRKDALVAVSSWRGLHITDGDNRIEAILYDEAGIEKGRIVRSIHYSGAPLSAAIIPGRSRLVADGTKPAVIAIQLRDKDGHPAREGVIGEYRVVPPHRALQKARDLQENPLTAPAEDRFRYHVGSEGIALIKLEPTTRTGEAVIRLSLVNGEQEVRAWLGPEDRDWILVGLAEGTVGYSTITGNMENLAASDVEDKFYEDGRLAFFARGKVMGKWLLTLAYDSEKRDEQDEHSLYEIIDPNAYYTLYGDRTWQRAEAASSRNLYVKLEREQFYALFGDFATGLSVTELSRYIRNLNGLKAELRSTRADLTVFASDTDQGFIKDEIPANGTSGLYRLSRRNIVLNSETVTIETRSRFQSEVIVSSQKMARFIDYTMDYDQGTIFFKLPVPSRDSDLNPVVIVVDYESFDPSNTSWTYGGRGALKTSGDTLEVGATYVHEGGIGNEADLGGVDVTMRLNESTKLKAEVAATEKQSGSQTLEGSAYLAEIEHRSADIGGRAYIREQDPDFGLGQQNSSESGTRKVGLDVQYRLAKSINITGNAYRQENLFTNATRDFAEIQARYGLPKYDLYGGLQSAQDRYDNGEENDSLQAIAGFRYRYTDRLTFRVHHEQSLGGKNEVADFPTRTDIGLDYLLTRDITLFAVQEMSWGERQDTAITRVGMKGTPWQGGQISSTMERQVEENGSRLFATTGLRQTLRVTKRWTVDAGIDRSATLHQGGVTTPPPVPTPESSARTDFTAVFMGAAYQEKAWSWNGRIEGLHSRTEDQLSIVTGAYGVVRPGFGLAARLKLFMSDAISGEEAANSDMRLSLAYRPKKSAWIILDRLDFKTEEQSGGSLEFRNWRVINNLNLNYQATSRTEVAFQYGAKYVAETIDDQDYRGYTDLTGLAVRYDITRTWDIGMRGSLLHSWSAVQMDYSAGASIGHSFAKNFWISIGYNVTGFTDRDFSAADFTAAGPFLKLRLKFDQVSIKEAVKWFTGK